MEMHLMNSSRNGSSMNNSINDLNESTSFYINVIFSSTTAISISFLAIVSFLKRDHEKKPLYRTYDGLALIGFTTFVTIISDLNYDNHNRASYSYHIYDSTMIVLIGCVYLAVGAYIFFRLPPQRGEGMQVIGHNDLNISVLILFITVPLIIMEAFMIYGCIKAHGVIKKFESALVLMGTLQKVVQALVYHFHLKLRVPDEGKNVNASCYLKIIALINFSLWIESIVMSDKEGESCMKTSIFSDKSGIVTAMYSTLIADYRLVCFILFVEQALHIDIFLYKKEKKKRKTLRIAEQREQAPLVPFPLIPSYEQMQKTKSQKSWAFGLGLSAGGLVFILQFFNILQYKESSQAWVNVFGMLPDIGVIIGAFVLLNQMKDVLVDHKVHREGEDGHQVMSHAVDILVILMGTIGALYWILKGSLVAIISAESNGIISSYLWFIGIKFFIRTISLFNQIYLFNRISDVKIIAQNDLQQKPLIDFALSFLIMCCLSVFSNAIVDSYDSIGEKKLHDIKLTMVLKVLYDSGHPIHLGFCMHLILHFCIVAGRFKRKNRNINEVSPKSTASSSPYGDHFHSNLKERFLSVPKQWKIGFKTYS